MTKADGTKFGKTETGTVWLDPQMTSPYAFFQFWLNADDRDVMTYARLYSQADEDQIGAWSPRHSRSLRPGRHSAGWPMN